MQKIKCFTSSSIGPCPTLNDNFAEHDVSVSITWDDGFNLGDNSQFRVFHQCEPRPVLDIIDRLLGCASHYDLILGFDERVLRLPNAKFLTESACSWLPRKWGQQDPFGNMRYEDGVYHKNPVVMNYDGCDIAAKKFAVSFLTSSKGSLQGHALRQEIYTRLLTALPTPSGSLEIFKHRSPPIIDDKRTILEPYMFSIVPENSRASGYYTEKIVDCFIAKTIPIYWGCTDIAKHFNTDGIIQFENYDDLVTKLQSLTPDFYHDREPAIKENFRRALQGVCQWSLIENYISEGIANKFGGKYA